MFRNHVLLLFFTGALSIVITGCKANEPSAWIAPAPELPPDVREAAEAAVKLYQHPKFDPPQLLPSNAFEVELGQRTSTFIPLILPRAIDDHEFLSQCRLVEIKNDNGQFSAKILERKESGFSDDFEPCIAITAPIFVDVNGDGFRT